MAEMTTNGACPEQVREDGRAYFEEMAFLCERRAATYGLMSRLFRVEADQALVDELRGVPFPASAGNAKLDEGHRLMASFAGAAWENGVAELAVDYARTFIGHGMDSFSAAYPYESVHTSEKRLLMQEARDQVLSIYRSEGLDKCEAWKDCEDHVGVELEFMQILASRTVEALRADDEDEAQRLLFVQRDFLAGHLFPWVPALASDMRRFAKTDLYTGLASMAEGFLEVDGAFLADVLADGE